MPSSPNKTHKAFAALAVALLCSVPAAVRAASPGGFSYAAVAEPAAGAGGTLVVRNAVMLDRTLHVRGTMASGTAGRHVQVQRQLKDGSWAITARATTTAHGAFKASWKTNHIGRFPTRAVEAGAAPTGTTAVTVYKPGVATYFGSGFYGGQLACGGVLRHTTLGVAHRTLPCGTLVYLYYKGRAISVPVIDRGPYRHGTTWDLTEATAKALRMASTSKIGAVRAPD